MPVTLSDIWTGTAGDDNWETPGNWNSDSVPTGSEEAVIHRSFTVNVGNAPTPPTPTDPDGIDVGSLTIGADSSVNLIDSSNYTESSGGTSFLLSTTTLTIEGTAGESVNNGTLTIGDAARLRITGTLKNNGTINVSGTPTPFDTFDPTDLTTLLIVGTATLAGAGNIVMSDTDDNYLSGSTAGGGSVLINHNTISGAGFVGNDMMLTNDGTIDANATNNQLIIYAGTSDGSGITNNDLIEATSGAGLEIYETTITNGMHGDVSAGAGTQIDLVGGAVIQGGTLLGNEFFVYGSGNELSGSGSNILNNTGDVSVEADGSLTLAGKIDNTGAIFLSGSSAGAADLDIAGTVTLSGAGGFIVLNDFGGQNAILGAASGSMLNIVQNTISGVGSIGDGDGTLTLNNKDGGWIQAYQGRLTIDTGNMVNNAGTLDSESGSDLLIQDPVNNTGFLLAYGGTLEAEKKVTGGDGTIDADGKMQFDAASTVAVTFNGSDATLATNNGFAGTVAGFADGGSSGNGDALDLMAVKFAAATTTATFLENVGDTGGTLTVTHASTSLSIDLLGQYLNGTYTNATNGISESFGGFLVNSDGSTPAGTLITYVPPHAIT